jgi:hypothetical protein
LNKAIAQRTHGKKHMPSLFMEIYLLKSMQMKIISMIETLKKEDSSQSGLVNQK